MTLIHVSKESTSEFTEVGVDAVPRVGERVVIDKPDFKAWGPVIDVRHSYGRSKFGLDTTEITVTIDDSKN